MNLSDLSEDQLKELLKAVRQERLSAKTPKVNPTDGQSWLENAASGLGKAGYDTVRGAGNVVTDLFPGAANLGFSTRAETDETTKRDAALMDTSGGFWGNLAGNAALGLAGGPAASLPKAAALGASLGFIQPVGMDDSRTKNTALGGAFGAAVPLGVGAYRGARALAEPVIAPDRAAARILEQFADDPAAMRLAAGQAKELVPGSAPTLAQVAQQPGLSTLERSMANQPGPMQGAASQRALDQNAARVKVIDEMSGNDGRLDFYKQNRGVVADELYSRAFAETPGDTSWIRGEVNKLMQRPSFVDALKEAQTLALDSGIKVSPKNPENATQLLHFTKMALDDKIETAVRAGSGNKSRALIDTRDKLVSLMESKDFSPSYREARDTFKQMSGPINEMELAGGLRQKLVPALQEGADAPTSLNSGNFSAAMRAKGDEIARVMSPEGKQNLEALFQDLQRQGRAESLGKAKGSPTAQFLTTQNLMRQIAGPMGVPQGFADKAGQALMSVPYVGGALQFGAKGAEGRMQQSLADLLMDPAKAAQAFALINKQPGRMGQMGRDALPYLPGLSVSGMFANR